MATKNKISYEIDDIVSILKETNAEKIFLFGSCATDACDENSDIDLLVVMPSKEPPLKRRLALRRLLKRYDQQYGLDLLVYTPEEFKLLKNDPSSFIYSTLKNGIRLYDTDTEAV